LNKEEHSGKARKSFQKGTGGKRQVESGLWRGKGGHHVGGKKPWNFVKRGKPQTEGCVRGVLDGGGVLIDTTEGKINEDLEDVKVPKKNGKILDTKTKKSKSNTKR